MKYIYYCSDSFDGICAAAIAIKAMFERDV